MNTSQGPSTMAEGSELRSQTTSTYQNLNMTGPGPSMVMSLKKYPRMLLSPLESQ